MRILVLSLIVASMLLFEGGSASLGEHMVLLDDAAPRAMITAPDDWPLASGPCSGVEQDVCGYSGFLPALLSCVDGVWAGEPCSKGCLGLGQCSGGCATTTEGARCLCVKAGPTCQYERFCGSHNEIFRVVEDELVLDTSCDAECRSQEGMFTFACATDPLAGEVACLCAGVGDACDAQLPTKRCTGQDLGLSTGSITTGSIVSCEEGAWVESSCAEECDNPDAFCIDGADDATCVC